LHLNENEISKYVDALLDGKEHAEPEHVKKHLAECDECASEVMVVYDVMKEDAQETKVVDIRKSKKPINTWIALAASVILIVSAAIYIMTNNNPKQEDIIVEQDPVIIDTTQKEKTHDTFDKEEEVNKVNIPENNQPLLAEAFIPNEDLEKLVDRFETNNFRGDEIAVYSSVDTTLKSGAALIIELNNTANQMLTIEVFNNKNELEMTEESNNTRIELKHSLGEGLHYWKLINEDFDLIYCGRFRISNSE
jgi:hypothetical protein